MLRALAAAALLAPTCALLGVFVTARRMSFFSDTIAHGALAGVDTPGEQSFYELIGQIQKTHGLTVVLVSHDLSMVYRYASWIYALNGVICCEGTPEQVMNAESLRHAYGIHVSPYGHHHHVH